MITGSHKESPIERAIACLSVESGSRSKNLDTGWIESDRDLIGIDLGSPLRSDHLRVRHADLLAIITTDRFPLGVLAELLWLDAGNRCRRQGIEPERRFDLAVSERPSARSTGSSGCGHRTGEDLVSFMEAVAARTPGKVVIIWDNLNVHFDGKDERWTKFNKRGGKWDRTPYRDQLENLMSLLETEFPWALASLEEPSEPADN